MLRSQLGFVDLGVVDDDQGRLYLADMVTRRALGDVACVVDEA